MRFLKIILKVFCTLAFLVAVGSGLIGAVYASRPTEEAMAGALLWLFVTLPSLLVFVPSVIVLGVVSARDRAEIVPVKTRSRRHFVGRILVWLGYGLALLGAAVSLMAVTSSVTLSSSDWVFVAAVLSAAFQAAPGLPIAMVGYWVQRARPKARAAA